MRWKGRRGSRNIEDRRGRRGGIGAAGGLGGVGVIAVVVIGYFLGIDVTPLLNDTTLGGQQSAPTTLSAANQRAGQFVSVTLADTEEVWSAVFKKEGIGRYNPPKLVLYSGVTQSPCGGANGASGPFYCPVDKKAYLDTSFFSTMSDRLGARGDFAAAYVVAHEIAHHVQNELGVLGRANALRAEVGKVEANEISVRIELQADCYSGIWARYAQKQLGTLEPGDLKEALNAARQIGDDMLQRNAGRTPNPHTFTHGTSNQREDWFARGYKTGDLASCDTFGARKL